MLNVSIAQVMFRVFNFYCMRHMCTCAHFYILVPQGFIPSINKVNCKLQTVHIKYRCHIAILVKNVTHGKLSVRSTLRRKIGNTAGCSRSFLFISVPHYTIIMSCAAKRAWQVLCNRQVKARRCVYRKSLPISTLH